MLIKHPIPSYPETHRKRYRRSLFSFGMSRMKQLSNSFDYSLTHWRLLGDRISTFKITNGLLKFPMDSTFTYPNRTWLRGHSYKFHQ